MKEPDRKDFLNQSPWLGAFVYTKEWESANEAYEAHIASLPAPLKVTDELHERWKDEPVDSEGYTVRVFTEGVDYEERREYSKDALLDPELHLCKGDIPPPLKKKSIAYPITKSADMKSNEMPRRIRIDLHTPAELAIYNAVLEVEKLPADVRLTKSVVLLSDAKDQLADFIDDHPEHQEPANPLHREKEEEVTEQELRSKIVDILYEGNGTGAGADDVAKWLSQHFEIKRKTSK
jgi:hypothetical protein